MTAARKAPGPPPGHREYLSGYIDRRVDRLQAAYLDRSRADHSTAVGSLARLRRAVTSEPGSEPGIWDLLFDGFPAELTGVRDEPSRAERSAHASLTLYAVHQQSQRTGMHIVGRSLGTAVGLLARDLATGRDVRADPGVVRRFQALGTASTFSETVYHARGLATQLRGAGIGMDYGRFAGDLYRLQDPTRSSGVRLHWGRDFYGIGPTPSTDAASGGTPEINHKAEETT